MNGRLASGIVLVVAAMALALPVGLGSSRLLLLPSVLVLIVGIWELYRAPGPDGGKKP